MSKLIDYDDWYTADHLFSFLTELWGPHTIDRFANDQNNKFIVLDSRCHYILLGQGWRKQLVSFPGLPNVFHNHTFVHIFSGGHYYCSLLAFCTILDSNFQIPRCLTEFCERFKVFEDPSGLLCLGNYKKSLLGSDSFKSSF